MDLYQAAAEAPAHLPPGLFETLHSLVLALVLGFAVALRPWRAILDLPRPPREMMHAQVLIAVAGALAVIVIGNSLAIAFGLVGLGGFIRFRTGIRDPRDAAVFFLVIGIGMACGLGRVTYPAALVCAGFVVTLLFGLDLASKGKSQPYIRITALTTDPRGLAGPFREAIESFPVHIRASAIKLGSRQLRFDLENDRGVAASKIVEKLLEVGGDAVEGVAHEELATLKGSSNL